MSKKIIAIDFDGTIVRQEDDLALTEFVFLPNAPEVIQWICGNFHTILWTCRQGEMLQKALDFLKKNNIVFDGINENAPFLDFGTSNKIFADAYVDDRANLVDIDWLQIKDKLQQKYLQQLPIDEEKIIIEVTANVARNKKC
jgi:hypothetical protein